MSDGIVFEEGREVKPTLLGKIAELVLLEENWLNLETLNEIMEELEE